jgi:hypothetical protein
METLGKIKMFGFDVVCMEYELIIYDKLNKLDSPHKERQLFTKLVRYFLAEELFYRPDRPEFPFDYHVIRNE